VAQYISQGSIFGRLGSKFGEGLEEQVPKEIERARLSRGLQNFEKESGNLSPLQQYTRLLPLLSGNPNAAQALQSLPEVLKQQNTRQAYQNYGQGGGSNGQAQPQGSGANPAQGVQSPQQGKFQNNLSQIPASQSAPLASPVENSPPQVSPENPTRPEALPQTRLSNDEFLNLVGKYARQFPLEGPEQWQQKALDEEQRRLGRPADVQAYDNYLKEKRNELEADFNKELQTHLHKAGAETFSDIPGDLQSDMISLIDRRLKENPRLNSKDAVRNGVKELFDFTKSKNALDKFATKDFTNFLRPEQRKENYSRLNTFANIYDKLNRNEELYNKLKTFSTTPQLDAQGNLSKPSTIGLGLSPQEAAAIAYPTKKVSGLDEYISKIKPEKIKFGAGTVGGIKGGGSFDTAKNAQSYAVNVEKYLNDPKASPLAIAREIRHKDPNFNQGAFFDQLRQDNENGVIKLNPQQERELTEGTSDLTPNWGDLWFLPFFK
jgi:hypothetical protein